MRYTDNKNNFNISGLFSNMGTVQKRFDIQHFKTLISDSVIITGFFYSFLFFFFPWQCLIVINLVSDLVSG